MSHPDPAHPDTTIERFDQLNLPQPLLDALNEVGYETPTPIQAQTMPHLLKGLDVLGHAPTGTGKTAAFALPLLARLDLRQAAVQVMVLAPTRELAIQVSEAFHRYAVHMKGFHVLPIYGGQDYAGQIRQLKRGVHVVVGTPGRVMDHMRKGTLRLDNLQALVLDEADEMLRMGFIDDVEWILEQAPKDRQMALFSATMPKQVERIARKYLNDPQEIAIKAKTATAATIRQRYWLVSKMHKLDALTRILEVEPFDALLMFVRTKIATAELAEKLEARGYSAAALNGDMAQKQREQMIQRLKKGSLDILVATDVAARGLDVDRISHVVNYDIPYDIEAYIHRIGRTGRAGRQGDAILFVAPRERRMLYAIEQATRQKIEPLQLPSSDTVNAKRISDFKQSISETLASSDLAFMRGMLEEYLQESEAQPLDVAAALAKLSLGDRPWLLKPDSERPAGSGGEHHSGHAGSGRKTRKDKEPREPRKRKANQDTGLPMERYRIAVGEVHGVKPGNIVGAIANVAELDSKYIGQIDIQADHSLVDLPADMPKAIFHDLKKTWVCNQRLDITLASRHEANAAPGPARKGRPDKAESAKTRRESGAPGSADGPAPGKARKKPSKEGKSKNKSAKQPKEKFKGKAPSRGKGKGRSKPPGNQPRPAGKPKD